MASSAPLPPSPLSSRQKINYIRLLRLVTDIGEAVLRGAFDSFHPPANLQKHLTSAVVNKTLISLKSKRFLKTQQWDKLHPPAPGVPSSSTFDTTLLFLLLRNTCGLTPPSTGWDDAPLPTDVSKEADMIRVKRYRNQIVHDYSEVSDTDFETLWAEIEAVLIRLGGPQHKTDIQRLKIESLKPGSEAFCNLPQKPSHATIDRTSEVSTIMAEIFRLQMTYPDEITFTCLSGNPGCGKSELARQIGRKYFEDTCEPAKCVITLNASDLGTLTQSYMDLAVQLGYSEKSLSIINSVSSQEQKLAQLKGYVIPKLHSYSAWMMIVDNVEDLREITKFLPHAGQKLQHGKGQIIITTQDSHSIPQSDPHAHHMPLSLGMEPKDAVQSLFEISGCSGKEETMNAVAKQLDFQPLALACAAVYVQEVRIVDPTMTWEKYLQHIQKSNIESTETMYEEINNSYKKSMTTAVKMVVQNVIERSPVMLHAFEFLAALASEFILLDDVVSYVMKCMPNEVDKNLMARKITKSSLVLTSENKVEPMVRVHQVVFKVLQSVVQELHSDEEDELSYLTKVIEVFSYLDKMDKNSIDYIKSTGKLVVHVVRLSYKVKMFFERREILLSTEKDKYGVRYQLNRTTTSQYLQVMTLLKNRLYAVLGEQQKFEICRSLLEIHMTLTITKSDTTKNEVDTKTSDEHIYNANNIKDQKWLFNELGITLYNLGEYREAKECYEKSLEMARMTYGNNHTEVATSLNNLGTLLLDLNKFVEAKEYLEKAIAIYKSMYGENHPKVVTSLSNLGSALSDLGSYKQAKEYHEKALAINKSMYGDNHPRVATSLSNLGSALSNLGSYKQAKEYHEKALAIYKSTYGENHPEVATSLIKLGSALSHLGSYKEAKEYYEKALAIDESTYGNNHPYVAAHLSNMGEVLRYIGEYTKSVECIERAIAIDKTVFDETHPYIGIDFYTLGLSLHALGINEEAKDSFEISLTILEAAYGESHPRVARALNGLGELQLEQGDNELAKLNLERALAINEKSLGVLHPDFAMTLNNLGKLSESLDEYEQAKAYFERALKINEKALDGSHPKIAITLNNLGHLLVKLKKDEEGSHCLERALAIKEKNPDYAFKF